VFVKILQHVFYDNNIIDYYTTLFLLICIETFSLLYNIEVINKRKRYLLIIIIKYDDNKTQWYIYIYIDIMCVKNNKKKKSFLYFLNKFQSDVSQ